MARLQMETTLAVLGDGRRSPTKFMRPLLLMTALFAFGCSADSERPVLPSTGDPMPADAADALRHGSAFQLLSLDPSYLETEQRPNDFHNWNALGSTPISPVDRKKLTELLIASVPENPGAIAACFNPRHGIRVMHENQQFDFVVCFECLQIYWYIDGEKQPTILTSGSPLPAFNDVLRAASIPLADPA